MSITQLAKDLNLSKSTVSRALNDYPDVSFETRERVQKRAEEIGYIPNPVAQRLKQGKSNAVGVVLPPPLDNGAFIEPFYSTMLGSLVIELEKSGLQLLVTTQKTSASDDDVVSYRKMFQRGLVDALLILRTHSNDPRVEFALQHNFPFVTYGRTEKETKHTWVDVDHEQAIYSAVIRQVGRGHRQIAFISTKSRYNYAQLRTEGYVQALKDSGIPFYPRWLVESGLNIDDGYRTALKLLKTEPRPTSIVCTTDDIAIGTMTACREFGLVPGKDIAIMGYGNSAACEHTSPPLTSIEAFPKQLGEKIGKFFTERLDGNTSDALQHVQSTKIIERDSDPVLT
ncbi:LacI family DNA-binding transcriptional regulator [Reinekea marinisedimentorum]|uniref:LacI family transcriptional regulator n=1 Tax=Reinekea marinisedimentorum TaxID=230495 RepID=A0A4R3HUA8_9GAMM|nr:LacI family DNA-binding transcriptional regulator [Reinekea marinisedimentorum]TCS36682.1 LacI family transcriptional regulator [Reinekea marinisedimentorum]